MHIVVKGTITVEGDNYDKKAFSNNSPFRSCISKINNTFIDNAEDLNIVMPMYSDNYSENYSMTSGNLWNYYGDEINDYSNENANNNRVNNSKAITSKSFQYKSKLIGRTANNNNIFDAEIVVPLKYLSNISRSLDLPTVK